jgi:hypothetical protein
LVIDAFARALHVTFLAVIPVAAIGFIAVLFLKELPLREHAHVGMDTLGEHVATDEVNVGADALPGPLQASEATTTALPTKD